MIVLEKKANAVTTHGLENREDTTAVEIEMRFITERFGHSCRTFIRLSTYDAHYPTLLPNIIVFLLRNDPIHLSLIDSLKSSFQLA